MKKTTISTLAAILLSSSFAFAQSQKGTRINYRSFVTVQEVTDAQDAAAAAVDGGRVESTSDDDFIQTWVNNNFIRIMTKGNEDTVQLIDKKNHSSTILINSLEQYVNIYNNAEEEATFLEFSPSQIKLIPNEKKTIAGYPCKLAKIEITNDYSDEPTVLDIWYTEKIPPVYWGDFEIFKKLPGAALEVNISGTGIEATLIQAEEIDESLLSIPENFEEYQDTASDYDIGEDRTIYYDTETGLVGLKNEEGEAVTEAIYGNIEYFFNGKSIASNANGKYGLIDPQGKVMLPFDYEYLSYSTEDEQYQFSIDDKTGLLDKDGKVLFPAKYESISFMKNGMASVRLNDKYGIIDAKGKLIIPMVYSLIYDFNKTHFITEKDDVYTLRTIQGNKEVAGNYDVLYLTDDPNIFLAAKDEKYGYINAQGKVIIPFQYAYASPFYNGLATVMLLDSEDVIVIDTHGNVVEEAAEAVAF